VRIGVDIGGTTTSGVLLDHRQHVVDDFTRSTMVGHEGVVSTVFDVVSRLQQSTRNKGALSGIGIGVPGAVDVLTGTVYHAINLRLDQLRIGPIVADRFKTQVAIDNDVNSAALGFAHWLKRNETQTVDSVAYLNLGTGLAAGYVFGGRVWRGRQGISGEIGHIPIDSNGIVCVCGMRGCLETIVSSTRLENECFALGISTPTLLDAVGSGDPCANRIWHEFTLGVAHAVRMLILAVGVDVVAIGGGLSHFGVPLLDRVGQVFDGWSSVSPFLGLLRVRERLRLVPEAANAGATGAGLLLARKDARMTVNGATR